TSLSKPKHTSASNILKDTIDRSHSQLAVKPVEYVTSKILSSKPQEPNKTLSFGQNDTGRIVSSFGVPSLSTKREYSFKSTVTFDTPTSEFDRFGGHLEHVVLHCNSLTLSNMKYLVSDVDQPVETKIISMIIASIAVGCPDTAGFLSRLLVDRKQNFSRIIEGPQENTTDPCDEHKAEKIKMSLSFSQRYKTLYELLSPALFLSLKCDNLGQKEFKSLLYDFKQNNASYVINSTYNVTTIASTFSQDSRYKSGRIMNYLKERKFQMLNAEKLVYEMVAINEAYRREKRETDDCLQLCLEEEGCKSVGYMKDNSQTCHMNSENRKDVGKFFSCGKVDTASWDYYEKIKAIDYFLISSKMTAKVLAVRPDYSVVLKTYTGDDNQLWYWDNGAIRSKKHHHTFLQLNVSEYERSGWGKVYISSRRSGNNFLWNFENNQLTSQYKNLKLDVKYSHTYDGALVGVYPGTGYMNQKWSLSWERFYFIITSRHSGKVLDASLDESSTGKVILWSYTGKDNQLWFWDDDNIRCKQFPEKVLDLHMANYEANNWGNVYLHPYNTGNNQRWKAEDDQIISSYKNLRLDVKQSSTSDRALVGGYRNHGGVNQRWTLSSSRPYFFILNKESGKVMDAASPASIELWHYTNSDQQLWFWDGDVIRNKKYANKVIDLHMSDYNKYRWGKIFLHPFNGGQNQKWNFENNYLSSEFKHLSVEVKDGSQADGSQIGAKNGKYQKWSLQREHDFFTLSSRMHAKVLDAPSDNKVLMWSFHGLDNQLWFMDEKSIRSKKYPNKVLDLHMENYKKSGFGDVFLHPFHGGPNQRWNLEGDNIISDYQGLRLDIKQSNYDDGALVGGYGSTSNINQKWSMNPKERIYFIVKGKASGNVLDAATHTKVHVWPYNGKDNQLWFWDGNCIRSKQHPNKVLDLRMTDYEREGWGKIFLHVYNAGPNQRWNIDDEFIISKYRQLRMDVFGGRTSKRSLVGGFPYTGNDNQKWIFTVSSSSCLDETESDIYNVVQYIPFVGTVWDIFSSIGYASAGCTSVAQERAVSFAIGAALDVTTAAAAALTGGTAAGALTAAKTGIRVGVKIGLKQGLKAAVFVTKQSIKNVFKKVAKQGFKTAVKTGIKKSGKLVIRELIADPALFLKNVGILSKKMFLHPRRTLKGIWKTAGRNIDDLKRLMKRLRCKRGHVSSCTRRAQAELHSTENHENMFKSLADEKAVSERVGRSAQRFMAKESGSFEAKFSSAPFSVKQKFNAADSESGKAELWAVYRYTINPRRINSFLGHIVKRQPLFRPSDPFTKEKGAWDSVDEVLDQADLIQSYLKKNPVKEEIKAYRWEQAIEKYRDGSVYETYTFKSTTTRTERFKDSGIDLTNEQKYPIEMEFKLKKSGTKIADLSGYPNQEEYLIPIGTQFNVTVETPKPGSTVERVTLTEIV
ncbi:unnamed protein product, partial [Porites lobata]